jgi:hypothetical protein
VILHVVPVRDTQKGERIDHAASSKCCCFPLKQEITSDKDGSLHLLFIHHAFDLREKWERQDLDSPGWVTVEELP